MVQYFSLSYVASTIANILCPTARIHVADATKRVKEVHRRSESEQKMASEDSKANYANALVIVEMADSRFAPKT